MYHILVAEDERIERMALVKVLSDALGEGYAIHEAKTAARRWNCSGSTPSVWRFWTSRCR